MRDVRDTEGPGLDVTRLRTVGLNRPVASAPHVQCPLLVQVGTRDRVAPPDAARRAGLRGELREYPVDHFDVHEGPWQQRALADQLDFLTAVLTPVRGRNSTPGTAGR